MSHHTRSIHAQAGLHRKLVLFGAQLELYLAHFPSHHKYVMAQQLRQAYVDVYNLVTEAQKRFHKRTTLTQLGRLQSLISRLGHARRTSSHRPLINHLLEHHHALAARLPQSHHRHQHV